ncbi:catalase [Clostridium baratii]|uniref:catalase n=1 Tax=Clostridium baratii str. Sullivan TaxID=1415775 RepID=A0A0A7FY25_9CLOT|nr:catalase [Clostridium baratii]AIY83785.1 catalase [Clostridium baratii str. Sullivan]CUP61374.1 catalase [Clostridium baratii]
MEDRKDKNKYMTTNDGEPIYNDTDVLTVGENGPILLKDQQFIDKIAHITRERMPPRVVHAKGSGAKGHFKVFNSMKKYTKADVFTDTSCETKVLVRFSLVGGEVGSPETARDGRGFAVKFYTKDGNYDIVGLDFPVFFIKDAIRFPDMVHAFKNAPATNLPDLNMFWDFIASAPESTQVILHLFSDRGTRKSYIKMPGYGINTYQWINKLGERFYVKYHWKPLAGDETISAEEATRLAGENPNVATQELYDTLNSGKKVEYDLYVQIMRPSEGKTLPYNPLDPTKKWSEEDFPLQLVGRLTLTDGPDNFYEDIEQAAFSPSNLVPGIEVSNDKLLQGRLFAYHDAQRYRIGTNFQQLPINKPIKKVINNERDGQMQFEKQRGIAYSPNILNNNHPRVTPDKYPTCGEYVEGHEVRKPISNRKEDDFTQAGRFFRSLSKTERETIIKNLVDGLTGIDERILDVVLGYFTKADKFLGQILKNELKKKC